MVCLHENVPLIRMGDFDIGCYDQSWIGSEIRYAANRAGEGGGQFPVDVAESVIRFLRDYCRGNVIGLDAPLLSRSVAVFVPSAGPRWPGRSN